MRHSTGVAENGSRETNVLSTFHFGRILPTTSLLSTVPLPVPGCKPGSGTYLPTAELETSGSTSHYQYSTLQ